MSRILWERRLEIPALIGVALLIGFSPVIVGATPPSDGLVLWLDAGDVGALVKDKDGRVVEWADRSGQKNHARQETPDFRPLHCDSGPGGRPVLRFEGAQTLNLGQPPSLDFAPGDPFTVAVVCDVHQGNSGTFISRGGGESAERAYQFYVAQGRVGAVTYGVMREHTRPPGPRILMQVCDGRRSEISCDGKPLAAFATGSGQSKVDVLIGARRHQPDNSGTFWPLTGDMAEILVYRRALATDEQNSLVAWLGDKYAIDSRLAGPETVRRLLRDVQTAASSETLEGLAQEVVRLEDAVLPELKSMLCAQRLPAPAVAELLVHVSRANGLSDSLAALAGELLDHPDPFVRGPAEWAITMKVGGENNGQEAVWPGEDPPPWYQRWHRLDPQRRLEADWARQALVCELHRGEGKLVASVDEMIERGHSMLDELLRGNLSAPSLEIVGDRLAELRSIRSRLASGSTGGDGPMIQAHQLWIAARKALRAIALANPAFDVDRILCVKRFTAHTVRNITRSYPWKHKPGGDLVILSNVRSDVQASRLLQGRLGPGYAWGLDLWWDADRVVFGYARQPNWPPAVNTADPVIEGRGVLRLRKEHGPVHIFEVGVDGSGLKQLTDDPYWNDFEPTYCAGGDIVFASDRCGRSAECGNDTYDHTNPNLYVMASDGSDLRPWTDSKDIDRYPHSLDDGRIAYTHWEYQERHFMEVHALWTGRPDGTMSDALFKHHMRAPCGLRDTRSIPGSEKLVAIATGHHTFAYGPVVRIDPASGLNNARGLSIITPGVVPQEGPMAGSPVAEGGVKDPGGLYQTPWALSDECFLVAYAYARPNCSAPAGADSNGFGIYLIDIYGNRELIYRDPLLSCSSPIPLRPRPRPPIVPNVRPEPVGQATCYVTDVYDGMEGVPRGTVKYLRISQHVGWPFDAERGQMDYIPGVATHKRIDFQSWSPVRVIGTVPVAEDGSACFQVPADTAIYFQALDQRHMEVLRMRSMVSLKPGEVRGCRGCHESQAKAPRSSGARPAAASGPPRQPTPPAWGSDRLIGYQWLVQPILDRHCAGCHDAEDPDGGLDFTATVASDGLYQSYRTMFGVSPGADRPGRRLVSCSDRFSDAHVTRPMQFGSHQSLLVRVLLDDPLHADQVRMEPDEWLALVTWVDANAPYHDRFLNKRPSDGSGPRREIVPDLGRPLALSTAR